MKKTYVSVSRDVDRGAIVQQNATTVSEGLEEHMFWTPLPQSVQRPIKKSLGHLGGLLRKEKNNRKRTP